MTNTTAELEELVLAARRAARKIRIEHGWTHGEPKDIDECWATCRNLEKALEPFAEVVDPQVAEIGMSRISDCADYGVVINVRLMGGPLDGAWEEVWCEGTLLRADSISHSMCHEYKLDPRSGDVRYTRTITSDPDTGKNRYELAHNEETQEYEVLRAFNGEGEALR